MNNKSVFISYAREDVDAARRLYADLRRAGLQPWLDVECLRAGQAWKIHIRKAIRESRYFAALLSQSSVEKRGFVNKEVLEALDLLDMYPEDDIYFLPLRLNECAMPRERLRDLQWIDLFPDWDVGIRRALSAIAPGALVAMGGAVADTGPLRFVIEKFVDSNSRRRAANTGMSAAIYFSLRNVSNRPILVTDIGLQEMTAGAAAIPSLHMGSHRVALEAYLARRGEHGETIPLFSCECYECHQSGLGLGDFAHVASAALEAPHISRGSLFFHSLVNDAMVMTLPPNGSESFMLTLRYDAGCATVAMRFSLSAQYHGPDGLLQKLSSDQIFTVEATRDGASVRWL